MKVTKAILPVAGFGTRFLPVTKAMPKEMLPIVDKPIIQYLVEEAVACGITDIIFVTGRGKRVIEDHFDTSYELERTLVEREKHELLALVEPIASLARFTYVRQPLPRGNGDAILRAAHLIAPNEPFAVLFGDDIVDAPKPALMQLLEVFERYHDPVVALSRVPREVLVHYGTVGGTKVSKTVWEVDRIVEKPKTIDVQRVPLAIIGKYILPPSFLRSLEAARERYEKVRRKRGGSHELGITDGFVEHLKTRPVYGVEIEGTWYDCGDKAGYLKANIAFARKRKELRLKLDSFLRRSSFR
jgi:UTP--glucose-1-phosphate uridylyltransferase